MFRLNVKNLKVIGSKHKDCKKFTNTSLANHTPTKRFPALDSVSLKILRIRIYNFKNKFLDSLSIDLGN